MDFNELHRLTTLGFDDIPLFIEICGIYFIYRLIVTYMLIGGVAKHINFKNKTIRFKFTHRTFDLVHYSLSSIIGLMALFSRPYSHCFYYTFNCGEEFKQQVEPKDGCVMNVLEKTYYMFFTAYYVVDVLFLWTANHDLKLLTLHHATTLTLIFISVYIRTHIIGICVMLLHDVVDVPLYIGKFCTYLHMENAQDISLLIFGILCTWLRMICFPGVIAYGIINMIKQKPDHFHFYFFEVCILFSLMFCHIMWFKDIVKAVINIFTMGKKAICDNRSDDSSPNDK